jgi:heme-degrading monooxygenase HmoA
VVSENDLKESYLVIVTFTEYAQGKDSKDRFDKITGDIVGHLETVDGLYGFSIRKDFLNRRAWTYTIWESLEAMQAFKTTEPHLEAMVSASSLLRQAKFARELIEPSRLNYSWRRALELLELEGRSYDFAAGQA